jgi:cation transport regulator
MAHEALPAHERSMFVPYKTDAELPASVRDALPKHAQDIYRAAYNSAWDEYDDASKRRGGESREETAHKVAWAAVKEKYEKDDKSGKWKAK